MNKDRIIEILCMVIDQALNWHDEIIKHNNYRRAYWRDICDERRKKKYLQKIIARECPKYAVSEEELDRVANRHFREDDETIH